MTKPDVVANLQALKQVSRDYHNHLSTCQAWLTEAVNMAIEKTGCSRKELAEMLGCSNVWLSYAENGTVRASPVLFAKLLELLVSK